MFAPLSIDYQIVDIAVDDVKKTTKSLYHAVLTELQKPELQNFRELYTATAASDSSSNLARTIPKLDIIYRADAVKPEYFTKAALGQYQHDNASKPGDYGAALVVDGIARHFNYHVPKNYDGKKLLPEVVLLHGFSQDGRGIEQMTNMNAEADKEGFVAVYPDAVKWFNDPSKAAWDANDGLVPAGTRVNDVGFIKATIENTEARLPIDPDRVYVAGFSNGGMLAANVANQLSDKVAATAIISSGMGGKQLETGGSPMSILTIHGTKDPIIPIKGLPTFPKFLNWLGVPYFSSFDNATNYWVKKDQITDPPREVTFDGVTVRDFTNGKNNTEVEQLTVSGGDHTWYGKENGQTGADASIDATTLMWQFFKNHAKRTIPPESQQKDLPAMVSA